MSAKEVVQKFGGQSKLAQHLGIGQSAIAYWVKRGAIPSKWHGKLLSIANQSNIDIFAADLIAVDLAASNTSKNSITLDRVDLPDTAGDGSQNSHINNGERQFLFYAAENGTLQIQVLLGEETVWASQKGMAEIFDVTIPTINEHLQNIFESNELQVSTTIRKIRTLADNGGEYNINFYNLDAIISVGYRVNSHKATKFRKWATSVLKSYLIKGFALDDERLKQGNQLFGKNYFDELLERIRKIRTSERMFWQKITDLYSQCSVDYDKSSPITKDFFAGIQNKFHYAIHHHTSAELIRLRADASKPNMGLTHYANMHKDGAVLSSDATIGKNYLTVDELDELDRLVENYLGSAELMARRKIVMTMKDWVSKLDEFLRFNAYDVLSGYGKVTRDFAEKHAIAEYGKFRIAHEIEFKSDFDEIVDEIRIKKRLPKA